MDLSQILLEAQSQEIQVRTTAEQKLKQLESGQFGQFLVALANELGNENSKVSSRQLAGLYLKNLISSGRDAGNNNELKMRWMNFVDEASRESVKRACLLALRSREAPAAHATAQVIAKLGVIEIPIKRWPDFLDNLIKAIQSEDSDLTKTVIFEALGYLCEDLDEESVTHEDTNKILTAIVGGMKEDMADQVRYAAGNALLNSLVFAKHNFEVFEERNVIMQMICSATKCRHPGLRAIAYESLARIASLYYEKLPDYMNVIFELTISAISSDDDENVAMMAIEFWSTLCEEEIELMAEDEDSPQTTPKCVQYVRQAAAHVIEVILSTLNRQDEHGDSDAWNVASAGAVALSLIAQAIGDDVVPPVLNFVEKNILSPEWRNREAALMAFGQVLDGPKQETLIGPVEKAMQLFIQSLNDHSVIVKDTAAWGIARICEFFSHLIPAEALKVLVESLLVALQDTARVAAQACYAVHNLAMSCEPDHDLRGTPATNKLSHFFQPLLSQLLTATERQDWNEHNLRAQAYEAVNMLIQNHAQDSRPVVLEVLKHVLQRLHSSFSIQILSQSDSDERDQLQGMLCSVIQVVTRGVETKSIYQFADHIVMLSLQVLKNRNALASEEAFLALGALASSIEKDFDKYMRDFAPMLIFGLRNYADWQVCNAAVGTTGDLCRALEIKFQPYCDEIVQCLLEDLQNPELNRQVKPNILSCFGDIALAIGGHFSKYLEVTLQMLEQAGMTTVPKDDDEMIEYLNVLREGILEAYTGIVCGLKDGGNAQLLASSPALSKIFIFLDLIARDVQENPDDPTVDDNVLQYAVGLIGDLADITPRGPASELFKSPCVLILMRMKRDSPNFQYAKSKIDAIHL